VDLLAELILGFLTNGQNDMLSEIIIDFLFVVVNGDLWARQVLNVGQHIERVLESHQEVVHLVETVLVINNLLEEIRKESLMPV